LYSKLLEERQPGLKIVMTGPMTLQMSSHDGKEAFTHLDNLWIQWQGAEDREDLVNRHANAMLSMLKPVLPVDPGQIIPIIKDATYIESDREKMVIEHLVADIYCVYAVDYPDRTMTLTKEILSGLGIEQSSLRGLSIENLQAILPATECHGEGPWYFLSAGNDYVASLLLFDGLWDQLTEIVHGDPVAAVPARDVLLFTGSESPEGLAAIRTRATDIARNGDHVISETLLRRRDGRWSAFD
jgi:uncharacterized protein YtpQ (UPF0354 family)